MNYSYIDVIEKDNEIVCWTRDDSGALSIDNIPAQDFYYLFIPSNDGSAEYKNLWNQPMKKIFFDNKYEMKEYAGTRDGICESDVKIPYKAILDLFSDANPNAPVNVGFYDIEVDFDLEDGLGFPTPANPHGEVIFISLFDRLNSCYVMFMPSNLRNKIKLSDEKFDVKCIWCDNEEETLLEFATYIEHIDLLTAWFGAGFDLPYLIERAKKCFGNAVATRLFCRNEFSAKSREYVDDFGQDMVEWSLVGRQHVDMMELYKKFVPGEKDSFSLDNICEVEEVGRKVQYEDEGDLGRLLRTNPQKYAEYSLHDARLLLNLDDKLHIMDLAVMLARSACVRVADVTGSVTPIEQKLIRFCREKGNFVLPDKKVKEKEKFPGAIVYDTISGVNKWTFSIDLTALYPSVMMMLGLSPETLLYQAKGQDKDYIKIVTSSEEFVTLIEEDTGTEYNVSGKEAFDIIKENGFTISANGTIFSGEMGILAEFVQKIFLQRKDNKQLSSKYEKEGNKELAVIHDLAQKVLKILCNSIYGATSNNYFRLFDLKMARSITLSGQMISKFQAHVANDLIEQYEKELA